MSAPLPADHFSCDALTVPRFREAGEIVLDQSHRDGRVDDRWLDLAPREFAVLWRLAAQPGERLCGQQLQAEAFCITQPPERESITADIGGLCAKLAAAGAGHLICTDGDGRYFLHVPRDSGSSRFAWG